MVDQMRISSALRSSPTRAPRAFHMTEERSVPPSLACEGMEHMCRRAVPRQTDTASFASYAHEVEGE